MTQTTISPETIRDGVNQHFSELFDKVAKLLDLPDTQASDVFGEDGAGWQQILPIRRLLEIVRDAGETATAEDVAGILAQIAERTQSEIRRGKGDAIHRVLQASGREGAALMTSPEFVCDMLTASFSAPPQFALNLLQFDEKIAMQAAIPMILTDRHFWYCVQTQSGSVDVVVDFGLPRAVILYRCVLEDVCSVQYPSLIVHGPPPSYFVDLESLNKRQVPQDASAFSMLPLPPIADRDTQKVRQTLLRKGAATCREALLKLSATTTAAEARRVVKIVEALLDVLRDVTQQVADDGLDEAESAADGDTCSCPLCTLRREIEGKLAQGKQTTPAKEEAAAPGYVLSRPAKGLN